MLAPVIDINRSRQVRRLVPLSELCETTEQLRCVGCDRTKWDPACDV